MPELNAGNDDNKEYKVEAIWNNTVYVNKSESGHLPGLYSLIALKSYPKEENTWELLSAVQHLKKLISCLHKKHLEKLTTTFLPINSTLPMARSTLKPIRPTTKWKQSQTAKNANKQVKNWVFR